MSEAELLADEGGGKGKLIVGIAVIAGIAAAVFFMTRGGAPAEQAPAEAATPQVFKAKSVLDDTQGPRGAKGQDVDRTPGTEVKKARRGGGGSRRSGGGDGDTNTQQDPSTKRSRKLEISDSKNPLGD
jgi:hypothetical protein